MNSHASVECLLSLPAAHAATMKSDRFFIASDPPGTQLGSGGGTVHLLHQAFLASGEKDFTTWLLRSRKLIVHGSGQSRRLPAYAAEGKPMLPLPPRANVTAQRPGQRLVDVQLETYERFIRYAPEEFCVMVTCGDVLVAHDGFPPRYPACDVLIAGLEAPAEEASHHGVMFAVNHANAFEFFLQKPEPATIRELAATHRYYLDTGVWMFSRRAVELLFAKCGWNAARQCFEKGVGAYEMFDTFGPALGTQPVAADPEISALKAAVLPLANGRFYHFGTTRSVIQSTVALATTTDHTVVVQPEHSNAYPPLTWVENACVPPSWTLHGRHMLTGIPVNAWRVELPAGVCVDMVGVNERAAKWCLRLYGFDDTFKGSMAANVMWMGRPLRAWLEAHDLGATFFDAQEDIQNLPLFPLVEQQDAEAMLNWMVSDTPDANLAQRWRDAERFSARDLLACADVARRETQRAIVLRDAFTHCDERAWRRLIMQTDLVALSKHGVQPPALNGDAALPDVHDAMFRARDKGDRAFALLRQLMIRHNAVREAMPRRNVLDDQIVWGRSPARLDFAGGWTDTPPYCLEHGGRVVNLAVNLNGQPPIQVFARVCETPHLKIRSIDVGVEETLTTFDTLCAEERLGSGFSIARAALRLAGFDPAFNPGIRRGTLEEFLKTTFGGGIELSLLAAIPKGSGLGTSSILAATILGTLSEMCGLHWSLDDIFLRTLVLEQMLTSGGGWQDQVGGVAGGLKFVSSRAGLLQHLDLRWLSSHMIERAIEEDRFLLYYTGMTRVAQNILGEIVRGLFLNDSRRIRIINEVGLNADFAADAIQRQSWDDFCEAIRRSWLLNQALDEGTNPAGVQAILDRVRGHVSAAKLLGAGGGGYLMLLADSHEHGLRVRELLTANPPNPRARFVDLSVSQTGFQVTRS